MMRQYLRSRQVFIISALPVAIMAVLAIVLRFSLWFMIAEPIRAVDLWCGKTYKPQ